MQSPHDETHWHIIDLAHLSTASNSVMFTMIVLWVNSRLTSVCCVVVGLFTGQAPSSLENKEVKGVFVLHVCLTCFTFVLHASLTSCSGERVTGFINTNMPVFMLSVITMTVYGYFNSMCTFITVCVWREACCGCVQMHRTGELTLWDAAFRERERERGWRCQALAPQREMDGGRNGGGERWR